MPSLHIQQCGCVCDRDWSADWWWLLWWWEIGWADDNCCKAGSWTIY